MNHPSTRNAFTAALLIPIVILAGLHLASIGPYWVISPDSATYVGLGRALASGEPWARELIQPPVTSLIFAAVLRVFPDGYVALNAVNHSLVLLSLVLGYGLLKRLSGRNQALLVVLLCLASMHLYRESIRLLSEPAYLVVSLGALLLLDRTGTDRDSGQAAEPPSGIRLREGLGGAMLVLAAMTRLIGVSLPIAVLLVEGTAFFRRKRKPRLLPVSCALLALLVVALWELYTRSAYLSNWFQMFLQEDAGAAADGAGMLGTVVRNFRFLPGLGAVFLNTWSTGTPQVDVLWRVGGILLFGFGLGLSLRRGGGLTEVYTLLYFAVVAAHLLGGGYRDARFLVPALPLLFHYACEAARHLDGWAERASQSRLSVLLRMLGGLYVLSFVTVGAGRTADGVREAHTSPFGDYPIKRPQNYDMQRLALQLKTISAPEDRFASWHRDMVQVISERRGTPLPAPGRLAPDSLVGWIVAHKTRYVLLDHQYFPPTDPVHAAVRADPGTFRLLTQLPMASLYEVRRGTD